MPTIARTSPRPLAGKAIRIALDRNFCRAERYFRDAQPARGTIDGLAQLFHPGANSIARIALVLLVAMPACLLALAIGLQRSDYVTGQYRVVEQTVPFSHKHHAGELGIDCRFCHTTVETGAKATVPTTQVCMTCHSQMWTNAAMLAPVRQSYASGGPMAWSRVNRLPDYVYFDHHVHVRNGVPCAACHGDLRAMPLTAQAAPLTMEWCLACHRDPARRLVPQDRITAARPYDAPIPAPAEARLIAHLHGVQDARKLTDCSTCHR